MLVVGALKTLILLQIYKSRIILRTWQDIFSSSTIEIAHVLEQ